MKRCPPGPGALLCALARPAALLCALARPAAAAPPREVVALIVTNNHSAELSRPDLHYADDDGVKYRELFRGLAPDENVALLTELDADTARLYPALAGTPPAPTRAAVRAATERLAARARAARSQGREVDFYFVFAGHGDVDRGRGFVELRDGPLTGDDLEALLAAVPATRAHVLLDSCNSFFVVQPRKPGGRHFATPEDATRGLGRRLPHVGVFVSTSAEAEVFEWSELQSGIFSHAVRSGLTGAADVDRDGAVSYDELRAFVHVAAERVKNPLYRPRVFARGPGGRDRAPLVDLGRWHAFHLELGSDAPARLTLHDADDIPWVDVHKEAGVALTLRLPSSLSRGATAEVRRPSTASADVPRRLRYDLVAGDESSTLRLAAASPETPPARARGPNEMLRQLFASPFGPRALAEYRAAEPTRKAPVYGVAHDDLERMRLLLRQAAEGERDRRLVDGVLVLGLGSLAAAQGALSLRDDGAVFSKPGAYAMLGLGGVGGALGIYRLLTPYDSENVGRSFDAAMDRPGTDQAHVAAATERHLLALAAELRVRRLELGAVGLGFTAVNALALTRDDFSDASPARRELWRSVNAAGAVLGGAMALGALAPYPMERVARLWAGDPSLLRLPRPSVTLAPGGGTLALGGQF